MNRLLQSALLAIATAVAVPVLSFAAQAAPPTARAYAPENLGELSRNDQVRVISLEYSEQSNGRRIPDDQLRFYLDQVNRSNWTFSRIKQDIARALAGGGYQPQPPIGGGNIRCESTDGRSSTCRTPWQGDSRLVRQLSDSSCIEGRSWQSQNGQVWVDNGCRAEFAQNDYGRPPIGSGDTIRCESDDNRSRTCRTPWSGPSRLVRKLSDSPCTEGRSWQSQSGQVYVSNGCRGEFASGAQVLPPQPPVGSETIRCESDNGRARTCQVPWRHQTRLVRQLSGTACVEGRTWQSHTGYVYVSGGCRGEFASRRQVSPGNPGNGSNYSVTCASKDDRRTSCAWNSHYGRPYLQRQLSDARCRENSTWGYDGRAIWVSNGCRALFGTR